MKTCPKCGAVAADDAQGFCLMDGTPLIDEAASEPTVVMSHSQPTVTAVAVKKKRGPGIWILLGLVSLLVVGGLIAALLFAAYRMGTESAKVNVAGSPTQKPGSPRPTPQTNMSEPVKASPSAETSPDVNIPTDEVTPVTWSTAAVTFDTTSGKVYHFSCPPGGTASAIWGSDVYTADSSVCTAAVHAGKITLDNGGDVTIEFGPGHQTYGATTRNGITSYNFGAYAHSFTFKDH
jgi:hypothetical protein